LLSGKSHLKHIQWKKTKLWSIWCIAVCLTPYLFGGETDRWKIASSLLLKVHKLYRLALLLHLWGSVIARCYC
jgi:hypothetical protein